MENQIVISKANGPVASWSAVNAAIAEEERIAKIMASLENGESLVEWFNIKSGDVLRNIKGNKVATVESFNNRTEKVTVLIEEHGHERYWKFMTYRQIAKQFPIKTN
jgi:hypothetical protein